MPDITMCQNDDCPMAKECYRHEAEPTPRYQSYTHFHYQDGTCDSFMEIWDRETSVS